jgi:hypothetical protein
MLYYILIILCTKSIHNTCKAAASFGSPSTGMSKCPSAHAPPLYALVIWFLS